MILEVTVVETDSLPGWQLERNKLNIFLSKHWMYVLTQV